MKPILLDLPMPIKTPRLLIRPWQADDGKIMAEAINGSLDSLKPWMPFAQKPSDPVEMEEFCRKAAADFILRTNFNLGIYTPDGREFIGSTGFHRPNWDVRCFEVGYWIGKKFEGKGFITESTNALTRYAFAVLKANRLEIRCDDNNLKSLAVMKRLGFNQEGVLRSDALAVDGQLRNTIVTARYDAFGLPELAVSW